MRRINVMNITTSFASFPYNKNKKEGMGNVPIVES